MYKPIKVLHLIHSLKFGGAEKLLIPLTTRIDTQRFKPTVGAICYGGPVEDELTRKGVCVKVFGKKAGMDFSVVPRLIAFMRREGIDIVHTHLPTADNWGRISARLAGVPIIVSTFHGPLVGSSFADLLREKILSTLVDAFVAVSQVTVASLRRRLGFRKRIVLVYNSIAPENFRNDVDGPALKKKLGIPPGSVVIGNVGRLEKMKGQSDFLKALEAVSREYENVFGLVIGEGRLEESLKELALELRIAERCLFLKNREDMAELLKVMDVFVISSVDSEGLPLVLLEAMASGVPIVTTGIGGIVDAIHDGVNGLIAPARNPLIAAEKIVALLRDRKLARTLAENAVTSVKENFSEEKMVEKVASLYETLVNEKGLR